MDLQTLVTQALHARGERQEFLIQLTDVRDGGGPLAVPCAACMGSEWHQVELHSDLHPVCQPGVSE